MPKKKDTVTTCLVAHTTPAGCRVAHSSVVAGHTSRTMGFATGSVPLRVTHKGAVESITSTSVTITKNWLKQKRARRRLLWSHPSRDNQPYYSGTRELWSTQCRWQEPLSITSACSHLTTGTDVHRVRQRSDVDLVEESS